MHTTASRRAEFVQHPFPHDFINQARQRNRHHPHSVAVLLPTESGMVLCAESADAEDRAEYGLVPPQVRYTEAVCRERDLERLVTTLIVPVVTDRTVCKRMRYLGSSWGTKRGQTDVKVRTKHVHWYGAIVFGSARAALVETSTIPGYTNPRFIHLSELSGMHGGDALSADKWRMVRQAYVALAHGEQRSLPLASTFRKELAANQLLPLTA